MSGLSHPRTAAVVLGGGSGSRVGAEVNKVLLPLAGRPVLAWSLETVRSLEYVVRVVVVCRPDDRAAVRPMLVEGERLVDGGAERHDSEWNALRALAPDILGDEVDVVAIHDGARPLASHDLWTAVVDAAAAAGGAIPAHPLHALVHADGSAAAGLVGVQTPQAFRAGDLLAAYAAADEDGFRGTDTASCLERYGALRIAGVEAPATNLKITFPEDVRVAERLLLRSEE
ncbi:MAG TPA: 2-C-methyl-D-erythritol 4-phosphate cytidylyltransferase [Nocardioidaceae bacterium]|nr:2-C-methyl-D-erythritol 4-phosphate cytidylyltransferase [Nocardioidaceae bacterium]